MAKRLIPALNRVLVEKIVPPSKTTSGILLPEKTTKLNSGKVIAVGPGARSRDGNVIPVTVKEGDVVLLPEYGGTEVKLGDKDNALYMYVFNICVSTELLDFLTFRRAGHSCVVAHSCPCGRPMLQTVKSEPCRSSFLVGGKHTSSMRCDAARKRGRGAARPYSH
ncbi:uncharacterized protein A4U43_C08F30420 [Asparagus officinalis]|nr:uncharacterized protein A4U43_C08F30420 [Asparagus officinalis]